MNWAVVTYWGSDTASELFACSEDPLNPAGFSFGRSVGGHWTGGLRMQGKTPAGVKPAPWFMTLWGLSARGNLGRGRFLLLLTGIISHRSPPIDPTLLLHDQPYPGCLVRSVVGTLVSAALHLEHPFTLALVACFGQRETMVDATTCVLVVGDVGQRIGTTYPSIPTRRHRSVRSVVVPLRTETNPQLKDCAWCRLKSAGPGR